MNASNTSTDAFNTSAPVAQPFSSSSVPTVSPSLSPLPQPERIEGYRVETSSGKQDTISKDNAVVLQIFTGDEFTAEPQPPLVSGTTYIIGQLEDRFVFHSPLAPNDAFYPYLSGLNVSVIGVFPYQNVAINFTTGGLQGRFTSTCDVSPLPIVPFVITDSNGNAPSTGLSASSAEFDEDAPANITVLTNASMIFEGYNRRGLIGPYSIYMFVDLL